MRRVVEQCGVFAALVLLMGVAAAPAQKVTPVAHLDADRLRGTWYEIARIPVKSEKDCGKNASELIAFGTPKNSVTFVNSCTGKHGDADLINLNAKQAKSGAGTLKVRRLLILSKSYDVIAIAQDNSWMAVGTPNHKNLWVLSKVPSLEQAVLGDVESRAAAQGYTVAKLVMTPQDPLPKQLSTDPNGTQPVGR